MDFVLFWFFFAVVVAVIASSRGRSGIGWFLLAVVISPLLAGILVLALPGVGAAAPAAGPSPDTHVKRPDCRELILSDARVCKHCGCRLAPQVPA